MGRRARARPEPGSPVDEYDDRVSEQLLAVALPVGRSGPEYPTDVRVEEAVERAMGIPLAVGVRVVGAMMGRPVDHVALEVHRAEDEQHGLQHRPGLEASVGGEPVVPERRAEPGQEVQAEEERELPPADPVVPEQADGIDRGNEREHDPDRDHELVERERKASFEHLRDDHERHHTARDELHATTTPLPPDAPSVQPRTTPVKLLPGAERRESGWTLRMCLGVGRVQGRPLHRCGSLALAGLPARRDEAWFRLYRGGRTRTCNPRFWRRMPFGSSAGFAGCARQSVRQWGCVGPLDSILKLRARGGRTSAHAHAGRVHHARNRL